MAYFWMIVGAGSGPAQEGVRAWIARRGRPHRLAVSRTAAQRATGLAAKIAAQPTCGETGR